MINKYISLDVGGSAIKFGVLNEQGEVLEKGSIVTNTEELSKFIDDIKDVVMKYREKYVIKGLACSFPGAVDTKAGVIGGTSAVPCIHNVKMKKLLEEATGLEVAMENDANCSALAEAWIGAAKDVDNFASVVCGTGIGGAIIINKRILKGKHLHAGEFGYMLVTDEESESNLGPVWSRAASTGALVRKVAKAKGIPVQSLSGKDVFEMEEYDEVVKIEVDKWFKRLAKGIYNIQYILDPEKILIGGAISVRDDFIKRLNGYLDLMKDDEARLDIKVEKCVYANDSNLIGALYNFLYC